MIVEKSSCNLVLNFGERRFVVTEAKPISFEYEHELGYPRKLSIHLEATVEQVIIEENFINSINSIKIRDKKVEECSIEELLFAIQNKIKEEKHVTKKD